MTEQVKDLKYNHQQIEQKWRQVWEETQLYKAPTDATAENKSYVLPQLPYPSGEGLHAGHAEVYSATDIFARFQRMNGKKVLQVIGWDAFGLPAENFAIKTNIHPRVNTDRAIGNFREQIKSLGISLDWEREVGSHNPDYYKWTQWFFLFMYERGLAYRAKQTVNWCDNDKTVLANEQVEDGKCERCGAEVEQREMEQWFLRITEYADRLIDDLDKVDWPAETVKRQRDWIGRSEGAEVTFKIVDSEGREIEKLDIFTTAHETIYGATFAAIAPEHKIIANLQQYISNKAELEKYIQSTKYKTELERQQQKDKTGIELVGIKAVNPANNEQIPLFVADYVLGGYGTGALMAVPAHDERDYEFAQKYDLPIVYVTRGINELVSYSAKIKAKPTEYTIANSQEFDGMDFASAREKMLAKFSQAGFASKKTTYKLRDWSVSRQRFWGAPVPMVYDPEGNIHPVKIEDLPVILPDDVDFKPTGQSPLTYSPSFQGKVEEIYGKGWRREVDTLDTFMCSSWYFFRYLDPKNEQEFASKQSLNTWMPVDFYLGGTEHVNGHLLYSRFFTKVLYDAGYISFDEPFLVHRHQGTIFGPDGRRMSKRWGNVINPTDVVASYGADTMRMYEMFMGPLEQDKAWNETAVQGVRRFLQKVHDLGVTIAKDGNGVANDSEEVQATIHGLIKKVTADTINLSFNTAIAEFMKAFKVLDANQVSKASWQDYLKLLAPYAPFLTEELWSQLGFDTSIHTEKWPQYDEKYLNTGNVEIVIQINGKVRDRISVNTGLTEVQVLELAKKSVKVAGFLEGNEITKTIFVENKLLNIVISA